jgi:lysophospholipase L1-like esterase
MTLALAIAALIGLAQMLHPDAPMAAIPGEANKILKIVAFGTSLTERANWPERLGPALSACTGQAVRVERVAKSGETTEWGIGQVDRVIGLAPDVILIELYANDAAINRWISVGASRSNYATILDRLHAALPNARIVTMSMNPFSGMRRLIRPYLQSYIDAHRKAALERGMDYADNAKNWVKLGDDELGRIIPDGSHPLPDEASRIIVPELVEVLSSGRCE